MHTCIIHSTEDTDDHDTVRVVAAAAGQLELVGRAEQGLQPQAVPIGTLQWLAYAWSCGVMANDSHGKTFMSDAWLLL